MYEMLLEGVAGAMSGGGGAGGGGGGQTTSSQQQSAAGINVTSMGVNLGAILQPLNDGNLNTGGYGVDLLSRLGYGVGGTPTTAIVSSGDAFSMGGLSMPVLIIGGIILLVALKKKRRG